MIYMANIITSIRFFCAVALLFFPAFSTPFYVFYLAAGLSDILDGPIARKTNSVSEFGNMLDTTADILLITVILVKLIPLFDVPMWLFIWILIILLMRMIIIVSGFVMKKRFVTLHTVMNKVTGVYLFIIPLTLQVIDLRYSVGLACGMATFSAVQESYYLMKERRISEKAGEVTE